jgi:site-specific recombinase XerD
MTQQQVSDLRLSIKDAIDGFILDLNASDKSPRAKETYRMTLGFLCQYAQAQNWPPVANISANHLRRYLADLKVRPRWFGARDPSLKPMSSSYFETNYRRIKTFFNWLKAEGEIAENPMARIPHPKIEEKVIPIVTDADFAKLLRLTSPDPYYTQREKFRAVRNQAVLWLLSDTSGRREGITGNYD